MLGFITLYNKNRKDGFMKNNKSRRLGKKALSFLIASSLGCAQTLTLIPASAIASEIDASPVSSSEILYGDADNNGLINNDDVDLIENYVRKGYEIAGTIAADVDSDNKITLRDAEIILQKNSGDISSLPYTEELNWKYYPDPAHYQIVNTGLTWQEAENKCEEYGAHLAVINSQREQAMIEALLKEEKSPKKNYWIGLSRNDDGDFNWITGEALDYTNWYSDNPNNLDGNQNAALFYGDHNERGFGGWDDIAYSGDFGGSSYYGLDNFGYIMEKDGEPIANYHLWDDPTSLPASGYYKLDCDVKTSSLTVNEFLDLDLNGHTVNIQTINCNGNVIIRDTDKGGTINCTSTGTLFNVDGSLTLNSGNYKCDEYSSKPAIKVNSTGKFENTDSIISANRASSVCLGSGNSTAHFYGGQVNNSSDEGNALLLSEGFTGTAELKATGFHDHSLLFSFVSNGISIYGKNSKGTLKISGGIIQSYNDFGLRIDGDTAIEFSDWIRIDAGKGGVYLPKGKAITLAGSTRRLGISVFCEDAGVVFKDFSKYFTASYRWRDDWACYVNGSASVDANGDMFFRPTENAPRYKLIETPLTWQKAKAYCESVGGHLVTITSASEQATVQSLLSNDIPDCWIGGSRNAGNAFAWVTDEPMTFTNWKNGEPSNTGEGEDCIKICNKSNWYSGSDDEQLPFVCEWEDTEYMHEIEPAETQPATETTTTTTTTETTTTTTAVTTTKAPFSPVTTEYVPQLEEQINEEKNEKLKITGELTAKPMTKEEIVSAGIDVDDPENYHYYKYSVEMTFHDEPVIFTKYEAVPISYTPSPSGTPVIHPAPKPKIVYPTTNTPVNPGQPVYIPQINATATYYEWEEQEMFIIIYGECKWLKEFYDVQLIVMNSDKETLEDCSATLNVPSGLTLCNSDQTQFVGDLQPNDVKNVHWYLRGDVAGDYTISALFKGKNDGDEFEYPFYSENDIHVYAGDALKMTIEVPSYSCFGYQYPIRITMTNVSDRPIYGLENKITDVQHGYYSYKHVCQDGTVKVIESKVTLGGQVSGRQSISAEELKPGESAVIDIKVGDAWKSPLQKDLENSKIFIDILSLLTSDIPIAQFLTTFTSGVISGITVVHVLDSIVVTTLEGSTTEIPYEIIINDNLYEIGEGRELNLPHVLFDSTLSYLNASGDKTDDQPKEPKKDDLKLNTKQFKEQMDDFNKVKNDKLSPDDFNLKYNDKYTDYAFNNGGNRIKDDDKMNFKINDLKLPISGLVTVGKDINNRFKPADNSISVDAYITDANGNRISATPSHAPNMNTARKFFAASEPAIEFEVTDGDYEYNDGVYTVKSEANLRFKANEPGEKFAVHFVDDDGYETIYPLLSVSEHECTGGNFYVASIPESGNDGLAVQLCTECGKPVNTRHIPASFYAMLSDGQMFQNVYQAAECAGENYDKVELSLFGDITLDKDLEIPDNVKLLITPFANITFKNSAHIVVGGEYIDFTDNFENEIYKKTDYIVTTEPTTEITTTPVSEKHIASDDDLRNWAINDYKNKNKNGQTNISAEITSKSNDTYEITLRDKDGNTVDVYTIDPVTGSGSNSANEDVDLPQTGNNAMKNWMILLGSFMLIICGWFSVKSSGFIRRKESEDQAEI
ncbi:MAG: hypothetical protein E7495_08000 [Ruminococcus flavefaciens]|jgi:hypothetical protein|nr:hypothetical protein [Ruminococcus flavefaciens]